MSKFLWQITALGRQPGHIDETDDPEEIRFLRSVYYVIELDAEVAAEPTEVTDEPTVEKRPHRKQRVAEPTPEPEETDEWLSASDAD